MDMTPASKAGLQKLVRYVVLLSILRVLLTCFPSQQNDQSDQNCKTDILSLRIKLSDE